MKAKAGKKPKAKKAAVVPEPVPENLQDVTAQTLKPVETVQKDPKTGQKSLKGRRQSFIDEYLKDPELNGTRAAIKAGYAESSAPVAASRLLKNAKVAAAIQKAMDERAERTKITQDYVLEVIRDTVERSRGLVAVRTREGQLVKTQTEDGEAAVMCEFDPMAALKGTEQLGRHLGMFKDKVEIDDRRSLAERYSLEQLKFRKAHGRFPEPGELEAAKQGSTSVN